MRIFAPGQLSRQREETASFGCGRSRGIFPGLQRGKETGCERQAVRQAGGCLPLPPPHPACSTGWPADRPPLDPAAAHLLLLLLENYCALDEGAARSARPVHAGLVVGLRILSTVPAFLQYPAISENYCALDEDAARLTRPRLESTCTAICRRWCGQPTIWLCDNGGYSEVYQ
jgi:hypothetical protein